jgi:signal transduction histidine kinase
VVSHDIRGPLNVAAGYLDQAEQTGSQAAFRSVRDAHDRIQAIVEDVLTLARQGRTIGETEPVALAEVTVDDDDLTLRAASDCWIEADPTKLRQLFENLFRNAAEHAGPSVAVTVGSIEPVPTTTRTSATATRGFYVADDGPGIPHDERASVFDPGYSTDDDGTGFGLSIVEQIAEAHGWSVRVSEAHDGGARFEVVGVEFAPPDDAGGDPFGG